VVAGVCGPCLAGIGEVDAPRSVDPDLAMVSQRWADLPAAIRAGIVAMVKAAAAT